MTVARCPHCEASLRFRDDEVIGRKVACPKCGQAFVVRTPGERPRRQPAAPSSHSRRKRPAKRSRMGLWIALGVGGAALLAGVIVTLILVLGDSDANDGSKYLTKPAKDDGSPVFINNPKFYRTEKGKLLMTVDYRFNKKRPDRFFRAYISGQNFDGGRKFDFKGNEQVELPDDNGTVRITRVEFAGKEQPDCKLYLSYRNRRYSNELSFRTPGDLSSLPAAPKEAPKSYNAGIELRLSNFRMEVKGLDASVSIDYELLKGEPKTGTKYVLSVITDHVDDRRKSKSAHYIKGEEIQQRGTFQFKMVGRYVGTMHHEVKMELLDSRIPRDKWPLAANVLNVP